MLLSINAIYIVLIQIAEEGAENISVTTYSLLFCVTYALLLFNVL